MYLYRIVRLASPSLNYMMIIGAILLVPSAINLNNYNIVLNKTSMTTLCKVLKVRQLVLACKGYQYNFYRLEIYLSVLDTACALEWLLSRH